jgi:hypothetical protein
MLGCDGVLSRSLRPLALAFLLLASLPNAGFAQPGTPMGASVRRESARSARTTTSPGMRAGWAPPRPHRLGAPSQEEIGRAQPRAGLEAIGAHRALPRAAELAGE